MIFPSSCHPLHHHTHPQQPTILPSPNHPFISPNPHLLNTTQSTTHHHKQPPKSKYPQPQTTTKYLTLLIFSSWVEGSRHRRDSKPALICCILLRSLLFAICLFIFLLSFLHPPFDNLVVVGV